MWGCVCVCMCLGKERFVGVGLQEGVFLKPRFLQLLLEVVGVTHTIRIRRLNHVNGLFEVSNLVCELVQGLFALAVVAFDVFNSFLPREITEAVHEVTSPPSTTTTTTSPSSLCVCLCL